MRPARRLYRVYRRNNETPVASLHRGFPQRDLEEIIPLKSLSTRDFAGLSRLFLFIVTLLDDRYFYIRTGRIRIFYPAVAILMVTT